jgi:hypothetical protein
MVYLRHDYMVSRGEIESQVLAPKELDEVQWGPKGFNGDLKGSMGT